MASGTPILVGSEPKTPLWLTCLGVALFLMLGLYMVFRAPPVPRPEKTAASSAPAASAAARAPAGSAKMDPAALKRLSDRLKPSPGAPAAPAPGGH